MTGIKVSSVSVVTPVHCKQRKLMVDGRSIQSTVENLLFCASPSLTNHTDKGGKAHIFCLVTLHGGQS